VTRLTTITLPALPAPEPAAHARHPAPTWLPVALGLLLLYVPTYRDLATVFWSTDRGAPGFVVLAIWFWLLWRERAALRVERRTMLGSLAGWTAIASGAALYALGRSQQMFQLEAGSQLLILPGISLVLLGPKSTFRLWFVWLFLAFTVPLPGSLVDALLVPLKELVAATVTEILYYAALPIARDGVVIYVGNYQMFIADACSGLNQLVALTAVGVLYVRVARHESRSLNALLLAAILPVATIANLARVTTLVLATYYGGDELGRQLHDYVSYAEIALAFGAFFLLDHVARALGLRGRLA
jgi:exosortase